ncbi:MAG: alkaline phosphatase family protein [Monoglobales bacterium]
MRTLLILVDGMRPDAIENLSGVKDIMRKSAYTMNGMTVKPSVTLPCHMSLFHSVDPSRHGTTTNTYAPQVRPINGLCEVLYQNNKKSAFFYNWEPLRDLTRPLSLNLSYFCKGKDFGYDKANDMVTDAAIDCLCNNYIDFAFIYLGFVDEAGHAYGWMSDEYMKAIDNSWDNIDRIIDALPEDYTVIITADHGGHDRMHGTDMKEDMTIPLLIMGKDFKPGSVLENVSIKDIAPTVSSILGVFPDPEWEGKSLI